MSSGLNVQLTDQLRRYVAERVSDKDVYVTPSEYRCGWQILTMDSSACGRLGRANATPEILRLR